MNFLETEGKMSLSFSSQQLCLAILNIRWKSYDWCLYFILKILFIYLREREQGEGQSERREGISSRLCAECGDQHRARSQGPGFMT